MTVQSDGAVQHEVLVDLPPDEAFWKFAEFQVPSLFRGAVRKTFGMPRWP